jgi:hypothetical protein
MTIVRVGLAETRHYAEGWDQIFSGKKKPAKQTKSTARKKAAKAKKKK